MQRLALAFLAAVLALPSLAAADPGARQSFQSRHPDWVPPRAGRAHARPAAAVTVDQVGDPDSFGRAVRFLGVAQSFPITFSNDCTGSDPTQERCVTLAAAPAATGFAEADLGSISLPGRAARSLICFALTPLLSFQFGNDTGVPQPQARWVALASLVVESPVLADPALVDPTTGLPFGGRITLGLGTYRESRSLAAGERAFKSLTVSRGCIGGLVSRSALVDGFGLTAAQAEEFFRQPITVRLGATGVVQLVDFGSYFYGLRLYGD